MEQRIIYNIYNVPGVVYDVTEPDGKVETFTNYDAAYRRQRYLQDQDDRHDGELEQRQAYLKRLQADIDMDDMEEVLA